MGWRDVAEASVPCVEPGELRSGRLAMGDASVAVAATFSFVLKGEAEVDAVIGGWDGPAVFCPRVVNDWAERGAEVPRCVEGVVGVKGGVGLARVGAALCARLRTA